jgi:hypothetical protein
MVQVLPQSPGLGELLGMGASQGMQQGSQTVSDLYTTTLKQKYLMDSLGLGTSQTQPSSTQTTTQPSSIGISAQPSSESSALEQPKLPYTQNQILAASTLGAHDIVTAMTHANDTALKQNELQFKKSKYSGEQGFKERTYAHDTTKKYADELQTNMSQAQEVLHGVNYLDKALASNKPQSQAQNLAYTFLKKKNSPFSALFQSENAIETELAAKSFAGGFRTLMGSKPTQNEFFWYEAILPGILKNAATNQQSRSYFKEGADLQVKTQDAYDAIVKKNGGWRPIDIDSQVREKMKPELDKYISKGQDLMKTQAETNAKFQVGKTFNDLPPSAPEGTYIRDSKNRLLLFSNGKWTVQ